MDGYSSKRNLLAVVCGLGLVLVFFSGAAGTDVDFLVPGVSLKSVIFTGESSVEYLVISEVYSVLDTSIVRLSILESEPGECLLEIVSSPYPEVETETVTVRLYFLENITGAGSPEEIRNLITRILVRDGKGDFREPSEEEIDDFDLEKLFPATGDGMEKKELEPEEVRTPAGLFLCSMSEFSSSDTRTVNLGGVDAERFEEQTSRLAVSDKVPFWGLVRSRVERKSYTKLKNAPGRGRAPRPKVVVTESILVSFTVPGD